MSSELRRAAERVLRLPNWRNRCHGDIAQELAGLHLALSGPDELAEAREIIRHVAEGHTSIFVVKLARDFLARTDV